MPEVTTPNAGLFADNRRLFAGGAGQIPFNQLDIARQEEGQRRYLEALEGTNRLADMLNQRGATTDRMEIAAETLRSPDVASRINIGESLGQIGIPTVADPSFEGAALRNILGQAMQRSGTGINQAHQGGVAIPAMDLNALLGTQATDKTPTSIEAAAAGNEAIGQTLRGVASPASANPFQQVQTKGPAGETTQREHAQATGTPTGVTGSTPVQLNSAEENTIINQVRDQAANGNTVQVFPEPQSGLKVVVIKSPEGTVISSGILAPNGMLRLGR